MFSITSVFFRLLFSSPSSSLRFFSPSASHASASCCRRTPCPRAGAWAEGDGALAEVADARVEHRAGLPVAWHRAQGALQLGERWAHVDDHHGRRSPACRGQGGWRSCLRLPTHPASAARMTTTPVSRAAGLLLAVAVEERRWRRRCRVVVGEARGEVGDAGVVVGDDGGEGEVGGERRRRAGALRVVQRQVQSGAVQVLEICNKQFKLTLHFFLNINFEIWTD